MNFKKSVFCLALQKYLSLEEIISNLNISEEDLLDLTQNFGREYPSANIYLKEIFLKKVVLPKEIFRFILKNKGKVSLQILIDFFAVNESYLVNMLYYYFKKKNLFQIIALDRHFYIELVEKFNQISINRSSQNVKIFSNNQPNLEKLKSLAKIESIETIALEFNTSPVIVEEELLNLGIGCYWYNENIRSNYPFVGFDTKFSKIELLYIAQHSYKENLDQILSTTKAQIARAKYLIEKLNISSEALSKILKEQNPFLKNRIFLEELLNLEKLAIKPKFDWEMLFSHNDKKNLHQFLHDNFKIAEPLSCANYLVATTNKVLFGNLIFENEKYIYLNFENKNHVLSKDEILFFKKVNLK